MVTSRVWFTSEQKTELWERWRKADASNGRLAPDQEDSLRGFV